MVIYLLYAEQIVDALNANIGDELEGNQKENFIEMVNKLGFNVLVELVDKDKITCEQLKDIQDNLNTNYYKLCIEVGALIFGENTIWSNINDKDNGTVCKNII